MNDFIQDLVAGQVYFDERRQKPQLPWWAAGIELVTPGDQFEEAKAIGKKEIQFNKLKNQIDSDPNMGLIRDRLMTIAETQGPDAALRQAAGLAYSEQQKRDLDRLEKVTGIKEAGQRDMFNKRIGLEGDLAELANKRHAATQLQQLKMSENNLANQLAMANINADVARYGVDARNRMALERDANDKRMMMVMLGLQGLDGLINAFT